MRSNRRPSLIAKLLNAAEFAGGMFIALLGLVFGYLLYAQLRATLESIMGSPAAVNDFGVMVLSLLFFTALVSLIVLVHEVGHAIAVRIVGAHLVVLAVGWFGYDFVRNKFIVNNYSHGEIGGYVTYDATHRPLGRWEQIFVSMAGPLATATIGLVLLVGAALHYGLAPVLSAWAILFFFDAVVNLLPFQWNAQTASDGLNIYRLLRARTR